jgi:hypothetical protein
MKKATIDQRDKVISQIHSTILEILDKNTTEIDPHLMKSLLHYGTCCLELEKTTAAQVLIPFFFWSTKIFIQIPSIYSIWMKKCFQPNKSYTQRRVASLKECAATAVIDSNLLGKQMIPIELKVCKNLKSQVILISYLYGRNMWNSIGIAKYYSKKSLHLHLLTGYVIGNN